MEKKNKKDDNELDGGDWEESSVKVRILEVSAAVMWPRQTCNVCVSVFFCVLYRIVSSTIWLWLFGTIQPVSKPRCLCVCDDSV
jgi:hypothetical protein